jgi:Flp pilus assembly protein TadD
MHVKRSGWRLFGTTIAALGCAAILAAAALAVTDPEQTREGYVAQAEPICKTNTKANERILSGVRREIRQGKLGLAAGKFKRAAAAFGKATRELKAVPQPVADEAKLTKWLGLLGKEKSLLSQIGQALKAGKKSKAQSLSVKLTHNGNAANNAVLGFEFNYCLINSSRFS